MIINFSKYSDGYSSLFSNLKNIPQESFRKIKDSVDQCFACMAHKVKGNLNSLTGKVKAIKNSIHLSDTHRVCLKHTLKVASAAAAVAVAGFAAHYAYNNYSNHLPEIEPKGPLGNHLIASNANALVKILDPSTFHIHGMFIPALAENAVVEHPCIIDFNEIFKPKPEENLPASIAGLIFSQVSAITPDTLLMPAVALAVCISGIAAMKFKHTSNEVEKDLSVEPIKAKQASSEVEKDSSSEPIETKQSSKEVNNQELTKRPSKNARRRAAMKLKNLNTQGA